MRKSAVIHECKPSDKDDRPADEQKWCLYTSDGSKLLGRHPSKDKAMAQERAIQVNKHASLRARTIRLAHAKPELRPFLLPLLKTASTRVPLSKRTPEEQLRYWVGSALSASQAGSHWGGADLLAKANLVLKDPSLSRFQPLVRAIASAQKALRGADPQIGKQILEEMLRKIPRTPKTASISGWEQIDRGDYLDQIWDMYAKTYARLGLSKGSKSELVSDYDIWEIARGSSGDPIAFVVSKGTGLGTKLGLAGSDGSAEGKGALKYYLGTAFRLPGHYAEVSHAVEQVTMKHNPPVVCAVTVPEVIKKPVDPSADGIHYKRNLSGVGMVEKVLIGNPRGIETTDSRNPSCPIEGEPVRFASEDDPCDMDCHLACQIDLD